MKTKLILAFMLFAKIALTQTEPVDYFGQTPPGDSAILFAPGIISLPERNETGVIFSADGKECYFTIPDSIGYINRLYYSKYEEMTWTEPVETSFLKDYDPWALFFSADNKKIYFTYNWENNIWVVERDTAEWGEPVKLPSPINSDDAESGYSETTDGLIYFSSNRDNNLTADIWWVNPLTGEAENLGTKVNSPSSDYNPIISPDGSYLIFVSYRQATSPISSFYICFNKGKNEWTSPVTLSSKINIPQSNLMCPSLSPEGRYLFFCRANDSFNECDIYWVSTSFIPELKKIAYAPQLTNQIPDINITTDSSLNYEIPENTFSCEYDIDTLKFTATLSNGEALPSWLDFNSQTRTLTGSPTDESVIAVTITVTNPDTLSASCTFSIVSSLTSLNQIEKHKIKVFPNPANNTLQIEYPGIVQKEVSYAIIDLTGKTILQERITANIIDISSLIKGVYLFTLYSEGEIIIKKILVKP